MSHPIRVVVCNWDNWPLLDLHLRAHALFSHENVEIVVVDQGEGLSRVRCSHSAGREVELRRDPTRPANYSTSHNLGAKGAEGIIVFLNDDVVVTPNWIEILEALATTLPERVGLVGLRATQISGPQQLDSGLPELEYTQFQRVVTGAAWCWADAFDQVGGFDPRFPYQWSDDALSIRFLGAGYQNWIGPPTVYHFGNVSSLKNGINPAAELEQMRPVFEDAYGGWGEWGLVVK